MHLHQTIFLHIVILVILASHTHKFDHKTPQSPPPKKNNNKKTTTTKNKQTHKTNKQENTLTMPRVCLKFVIEVFPYRTQLLFPPLYIVGEKLSVDFQSCLTGVIHVLCFHAFASVHCCLVVTCWERAGLLALVL